MEPDKKSNGALIGLIVIVVLLIVGGVYLWMKNTPQVDDAITAQDSAGLDALGQELNTANVGIDTNAANDLK